MSDVLDYDKTINKSLQHIEDILVKFALQNYVAAGVLFLAYFTAQIPLGIMALAVVGLGLIFAWAIWSNIKRYKMLWQLHRITRDHWIAGQPGLSAAFDNDPDCKKYLASKAFSPLTFLPVIIINSLPALAAVLLVFWRLAVNG